MNLIYRYMVVGNTFGIPLHKNTYHLAIRKIELSSEIGWIYKFGLYLIIICRHVFAISIFLSV